MEAQNAAFSVAAQVNSGEHDRVTCSLLITVT